MQVPRDTPGDSDINNQLYNNQLYAEIRDQDSPKLDVAPPHAVTGHTPPHYEDIVPKHSGDYEVTQCAAYGLHGQQ